MSTWLRFIWWVCMIRGFMVACDWTAGVETTGGEKLISSILIAFWIAVAPGNYLPRFRND